MFDQVNLGLLRAALAAREGLTNRLRREEGQAFVEYALVLTLVAVAVALITQWGLFTDAIKASLGKVIDVLNANP
jgi:Flp pilus assembly pilin Flp